MSSQTIYKSYKFRLYPDADQAHALAVWFGCVRFVKNKLISNFNSWSSEGPNRPMTEKILKDDPELAWLKEVPAVILQQARMDVDETKKQYFSKTRKTKIGRPKYKKRSGHQSMRFPASTTAIKSFEAIKDGFIKLPKMDTPIDIVVHQEFTGRPVNLTVSRTPSMEYYVSILVEEEVVLKPASHREVGIDLGLTDLIITSDGIKFQRVKHQLEKTNQLLKKAQKKLAKKEKGSKSYERARIRVARLYARITRIRNDYYHNISTWLVSNYDAIYVENLNVNGMLKNHRMARVIQEAAWSTLVGMIKYKSDWYGKTFHQIDRWYPSSKTCSCCGHKVDKLPLDIREWACPNCGTHHDRDINAAINIKNQGQLDCYEQPLDQFWSDGTADWGSWIPMRLEKYASKTERPGTLVPVGIGTDEDTRSLVVY